MSTPIKFCKDCKWFQARESYVSLCAHPTMLDIVEAQAEVSCSYARNGIKTDPCGLTSIIPDPRFSACGVEAVLFEPK